MTMLRALTTAALVASASLAGGCVTAPFDGTVYSSGNTDREILFEGYSESPNETITLQALTTVGWADFATTTSSASPAFTAGVLPWSDAKDLYSWQVTTQIGEDGAYWPRNGSVTVRVQGEDSLVDFGTFASSDELNCMISQTGKRVNAHQGCSSSGQEIELIDVD